ncbi:MAG: hypothetical protein MR281_02720 [Eubacterium sp.]|nr:hypothetical protein [Eubacterium sp.]MDD6567772.1 hypothetical protein [Eubacteriales bacterium]
MTVEEKVYRYKQQLAKLKKEISGLKNEIEKYKKQQEKAENIISDVESNLKKLNEVINGFHNRMNMVEKQFDGNFGKFYRKEMDGIFKRSGLYDVENMGHNDNRSLKNTILDIDEKIDSCYKRISGKEAEISVLKMKIAQLENQIKKG